MVHLMKQHTYESYRITSAYTDLPVTLDRVRQHLRNEDLNYDDEYVIGLIRGCAKTIEQHYGLSLLTQTYVETHREFPGFSSRAIELRVHPIVAITSIQYLDADGTTKTWDSAEYYSGRYLNASFVAPKIGYEYPSTVAEKLPSDKVNPRLALNAVSSCNGPIPNAFVTVLVLDESKEGKDSPATKLLKMRL